MNPELIEKACAGLEAWQRGDVDALAPMLDPDAELLAPESGEWDCHSREEVLTVLRERAEEGMAASDFELIEVGADQIVAVRTTSVPDGPDAGRATLITFRDGRVISMRQFLSREEAIAATP